MAEAQKVSDGQRWNRRPVASALLRVTALAVPVAASVAAGVIVGDVLPPAPGWTGVAGRLLVALAVSTIVLLAVDRIARRLLPLAALLRLSLAFPGPAPSRLGVAVRSRNLRSLRAWAEEAAAGRGDHHDAARAGDVLTLATALSAHDRRTRGHSERVRELTMLVAAEMGIEGAAADRLQWAALLHDIGKLTVPAEILNKRGAPDDREWRILQRHPANGAEIAGPLHHWLGDSYTAVGQHHERWDGGGYPNALAGSEIGLAARIVAVTDSFETMTAVRSYKRPLKPATAREELAKCSGSHFDPDVVRSFMSISISRLTWTVGLASWAAQIPLVGLLPRSGAQIGQLVAGGPAVSGALAGTAAVALGLSISGGPGPAAATPGGPAADEASIATPSGEQAGDEAGDAARDSIPEPEPGPAPPPADETPIVSPPVGVPVAVPGAPPAPPADPGDGGGGTGDGGDNSGPGGGDNSGPGGGDNSGPGGGDNSGPGGGDDDNSGPGGGDDANSGSGDDDDNSGPGGGDDDD